MVDPRRLTRSGDARNDWHQARFFGTAVAERLDRNESEAEIRLFVAALAGVVIAALEDSKYPKTIDAVRQSVDYLRSGFSPASPKPHALRERQAG
jgi:hypothetical protein